MDEQMGEDSISRIPGVALAPHPYLAARHAVNDGGRNAVAAAASASAQVAKWVWTFQELNVRCVQFLWMICGRD